MRKHRSRQRQNRPLRVSVTSRSSSRGFFRAIERDVRLRQQRCLEVAPRPAM
jgi:hypothetical protein